MNNVKVINRIGVLSAAKLLGALYALLGLIFGVFGFLLFAVLGTIFNSLGLGSYGIIAGIVVLFACPITMGISGFISGAISALLYNLVAKFVGGIELDMA